MSKPEISVQLYSIAQPFAEDMNGSLERLAAIGLRRVEAFGFVDDPAPLRTALDSAGLTAPTGHAPLLSDQVWTPNGPLPAPEPKRVFEAAATIGVEIVLDPFVAPQRWLSEGDVRRTADRMNQAAETAAGFGMRVGYHNHAQEFVASFDGRSAYELFVDLTDARVAMELDLFWALAGAQDVVALTERLGDRLVAQHVKDGVAPDQNPFAPDAPPFSADRLDQRVAGEGEVPLATALAAATALQYAVIEYDRAPHDVFEDIAGSYRFLQDLIGDDVTSAVAR